MCVCVNICYILYYLRVCLCVSKSVNELSTYIHVIRTIFSRWTASTECARFVRWRENRAREMKKNNLRLHTLMNTFARVADCNEMRWICALPWIPSSCKVDWAMGRTCRVKLIYRYWYLLTTILLWDRTEFHFDWWTMAMLLFVGCPKCGVLWVFGGCRTYIDVQHAPPRVCVQSSSQNHTCVYMLSYNYKSCSPTIVVY